ncbi:MAG: hypothetical protein HFP76_00305 [Methylococcales symbiont of Iophon sp. n. MRB-2018]|nr:MAG: hypothetical protein HFP76_00305 [Methylococcales symbiont of Iophon sp. n. MRB-2018]
MNFKQAYNQADYLQFLADKFQFEKLLTSIDIDADEVDAISSNMQHKSIGII